MRAFLTRELAEPVAMEFAKRDRIDSPIFQAVLVQPGDGLRHLGVIMAVIGAM